MSILSGQFVDKTKLNYLNIEFEDNKSKYVNIEEVID